MRTPCIIAPVIALALALPVHRGEARVAWAETSTEPVESTAVRLDVDVSGLGGYEGFDPEVYETMSRQVVTQGLETRGIEVAPGASGRLEVALSWRDFDESVYEVVVTVTAAGGEARSLPPVLCEHCTDDELVAKIEAQLDGAVEVLAETPEVEEPETDTEGSDETEGDPTPSPTNDQPPQKKGLAPLAWAGIGVAALGVGGLVAGGVLLGRDDRVEPSPSGGAELERTTYRPPAIGALAAGGALVVTGTVLIVVGQLRHARSSGDAHGHEARARRMAWLPALGPSGVGLQVQGRF